MNINLKYKALLVKVKLFLLLSLCILFTGSVSAAQKTMVVNIERIKYQEIPYDSSGPYAFIYYGEDLGYFSYYPAFHPHTSPTTEAMYSLLLSALSTGQSVKITFDETCPVPGVCTRRIKNIEF